MISRRIFVTSALGSVLLCGGVLAAHTQAVEYVPQPTVIYVQAPVVNIGRRHGNLRSAQGDIVDAYGRINQAQGDNQGQLGGHAQKAKELLIQADIELRLAANVSNAEGR